MEVIFLACTRRPSLVTGTQAFSPLSLRRGLLPPLNGGLFGASDMSECSWKCGLVPSIDLILILSEIFSDILGRGHVICDGELRCMYLAALHVRNMWATIEAIHMHAYGC